MRTISRALEIAFRSIYSVKWKACISVTTILIGSLAITATFTISENIDGYVDKLIADSGGPRVHLENYSQKSKIKPADIAILDKVSAVEKAYAVDKSYLSLQKNSKAFKAGVIPVSLENQKYISYKVLKGTFINPGFDSDYAHSIVLGTRAMEKLGMTSSVGQELILVGGDGVKYSVKVIGLALNTGNSYDLGSIWISKRFYKRLTGKDNFTKVSVITRSADWMNWTERFMQKIFSKSLGFDFWINNPMKEFTKKKEELSSFIKIGYILGFLALLAGSIGSTSVMLLNINIRKKEIGLYKSMGFSPGKILLQFTCETFLLSFFGGLIGAAVGSYLGKIVSSDLFNISNMSVLGFSSGLACALVVGVGFGLIPAVIAAKTDPVKVLQG